MPRANRIFLPGYVWHITHRCHRREFLLKFARDRKRWQYWLFEARKRYDLCVLNYIVTSNHIHLLVLDRGRGEIARSMQLIAGRTAQEYNQRKQRRGAYWEDRYHATAVDTGSYLARCLAYIDLNMVRAGAVSHPEQWDVCGYRELQHLPERYRIVDVGALQELLGIRDLGELRRARNAWVESALSAAGSSRRERWSDGLAVGSEAFVARFQEARGIDARHRNITCENEVYQLREPIVHDRREIAAEMAVLSGENAVLLDELL